MGTGFTCITINSSLIKCVFYTQDAGNNAQNLFHAPLAQVHKETSSLIQILATEVRI